MGKVLGYTLVGGICGILITLIPQGIFRWTNLFSLVGLTPPLIWAVVLEFIINIVIFAVIGALIGDRLRKKK